MNLAEILVIGGGVIGLAIATELRLQGAQVTLLSRDFQAAAGQAAAGMLAPRAEGLAPGPMLELCLRSLALYPDWVSKIEAVSGQTTGYWPCGILAPVLTLTAGQAPSESQAAQVPLSGTAIHHYQPGLNPAVKGGWFYPEEGQVDSRALLQALRTAAQELGVDIQEGVAVEALIQRQQKIASLRTSAGEFQAEHYVLATGAWSSQLLPLPVFPCKGQMLALRTPDASAQLTLHRVLFGEEIYIVPRQDGRIVLGATTEDVGFSPHNTAAGIAQLLNAAIRLYPPLQAYPLQECWWGYRPTTPDQLPILGPGPCTNLTLATGHHRNGILLAPITAKLITQSIQHQPDPLLQPFSYDRFHSSDPSTPDPTTFLGRQGNPAPTLHPT
ncbi:glycine oxidase ThiO, partial [Romeria aff. gracilis LEGE 07310]